MQSAPGVYPIKLPLPFELKSVNVFLVKRADGYMLVDAGLGTNACFKALSAAIENLHIQWKDIRQLLLTHMHPDHIGLIPRLRELTGAPVWMHRVEAKHLELFADSGWRTDSLRRALDFAGTPAELRAPIDQSFSEVRKYIRQLDPERLLEGGETIDVDGGALEAIWTPGHSPGHICLYHRERRYLISGDHLLQKITPNIAWDPDRDALGDYLESLELLRGVDVDLVLPSHGDPFDDQCRRIGEVVEHHAERCSRIISALTAGPRTAHALVSDIWKQQFSPFHYHFAVMEVLAHCDHLQRRGRLTAHRSNGGPAEWSVEKVSAPTASGG